MQRLLVLPILLAGINMVSFCQQQSPSLLADAEAKLRSQGSTVSAVLTDTTYESLHPLIDFRDMIRKYCAASVLRIAPLNEPGRKIKVVGTARDKDGRPVAGALVYLYQTDARGWYAADAPHILLNEGDFRHARLFGYVKTDNNGRFELHTIKPAGYPQSDLPAHIHIHVTADGFQAYEAEFLFADDERLKGETLNRAIVSGGIIGKPEKAGSPFTQQFSYELKLRKQ
jgi:protocatechuate 3,4-dioxygenase beta subunit